LSRRNQERGVRKMKRGGMASSLLLLGTLVAAGTPKSLRAQDPAPLVRAAYTGRPMRVELSTSLSRSFFVLLASARPGPTPTPFGNLQVGLPFFPLAWGRTDASGKAVLEVAVPADRALAGGRIFLAALFADTSASPPRVRLSGGRRITLSGPLVVASCGSSPPMAGPALVFVDLLSTKILGEIVLPRNPTRVWVDRFGIRGFAAAGRNLYVLDIPSRKITFTIRTAVKTDFTVLEGGPAGKWCFALAPGTPFLPKPSPGEVVALDTEKLLLKGPIALSSQALDLAAAPYPGRAWAVTRKDRMVHLIDGPSAKILKSVQVGRKGETQAFAGARAGSFFVVTTGDSGGTRPPALGSATAVDPLGKAGSPLALPPYPSLLAPYRVGTNWFLLAACTWEGKGVSPSLHVLGLSPLKDLGTFPGKWARGATGLAVSPVLPAGAVLWSGNPGYPHSGFLRNGTLVLVDPSARRIRSVLTLPRLYQQALYAVTNPTMPVFLFCEKASLWSGGKLRVLDIPTGKILASKADLGRPVLSMSDV